MAMAFSRGCWSWSMPYFRQILGNNNSSATISNPGGQKKMPIALAAFRGQGLKETGRLKTEKRGFTDNDVVQDAHTEFLGRVAEAVGEVFILR